MSATTTSATADTLAALSDALRGQVIEGVRVHEASAEITLGADNESIVRLRLVVDDPAPDRGTWPVSAVRAIQRRAWEEAWRLGIPEWAYVVLVPRSEAADTAA
jgi:hypothetical protein